MPIRQVRAAWPGGWPCVTSSAWESAPTTSESRISMDRILSRPGAGALKRRPSGLVPGTAGPWIDRIRC